MECFEDPVVAVILKDRSYLIAQLEGKKRKEEATTAQAKKQMNRRIEIDSQLTTDRVHPKSENDSEQKNSCTVEQ